MDASGHWLISLCALICLRLSSLVSGGGGSEDNSYLGIDLLLSSNRFSLWINDTMVYDTGHSRDSGTIVLAIHEKEGFVVASRSFPTFNPSEGQVLQRFLKSIQPSRIVIVATMPEGTRYLAEAESALAERGCKGASLLAIGEAWACVLSVHQVWEVVVTRPVLSTEEKLAHWEVMALPQQSSALSVHIPSRNSTECDWHHRADLKAQRDFCRKYDGFPEICRCSRPILSNLAFAKAENMEIRETIPCVIVTSKHPYNIYRLLLQLMRIKGSQQTPFVVHLEVDVPATEELIKLFNLSLSKREALQQTSDLSAATSAIANVTYHAISETFARFPEANKIIILEDDLILSPDFLWYFQQTSSILDDDPTVMAVSAHHSQSFPGRSLDPTRVLRGRAPPQWGWMASRKILQKWMPSSWGGDWDYWLMEKQKIDGMEIVFPELSRSLHAGSAGTHITGLEQATFYNLQAANGQRNANISNLPEVRKEVYASKLREDISVAVAVSLISPSHCENQLQLHPVQGGPFIIYVNNRPEWYAVMICFRGFMSDVREEFEYVQQLTIAGEKLFVVKCPESPHCVRMPSGYVAVTNDDDIIEAFWGLNLFRSSRLVRTPFKIRRKPQRLIEEVELQNVDLGYTTLSLDTSDLISDEAFVLPLINSAPESVTSENQGGRVPDSVRNPDKEYDADVPEGPAVEIPSVLSPNLSSTPRVIAKSYSPAAPYGSSLSYYLSCITVQCIASDPLLPVHQLPKTHRATAVMSQEEKQSPYDTSVEFTLRDYFSDNITLKWLSNTDD
ncbi:protein O-linked-mannose beta-1,2-N-acetylglucosaminyltransferase 1-like isoform X2 [Macrobrachium nipponense]|uniref:protein O-linked-mannose beta-1,2-N-acetylglucosaminyltransferase 1-like isoform X2 n=1 Tax=Macrobrachium nipponense TaxID=159736 RepID=UPI0030C83F11